MTREAKRTRKIKCKTNSVQANRKRSVLLTRSLQLNSMFFGLYYPTFMNTHVVV